MRGDALKPSSRHHLELGNGRQVFGHRLALLPLNRLAVLELLAHLDVEAVGVVVFLLAVPFEGVRVVERPAADVAEVAQEAGDVDVAAILLQFLELLTITMA